MRYKQVVVIGSSDDKTYLEDAYKIGKFIAQNDWVLISGGRGGIMEAVSRGASEKNGIVIGIIPDAVFENANPYCNIVIPTGIGYARNLTNILSADVIIAIGGKAGTLSELAYAWQFDKTVILCTYAEGWSKKLSGNPIDDRKKNLFIEAGSLEAVLCSLNDLLEEKQ